MHRRFHKYLAALTLPLLAGGCVQATRHSNTMVFGTNTTVAFKVGTGADQVPEILLGYDRQEMVIMPLVANAKDNGSYQEPCDPSQPVQIEGNASFVVHPCLLVATNGSASDSFSVLASFGADFSGNTTPSPEAQAGIAQYFATGVAAQLLALKGGAALVSTGSGATASANHNIPSSDLRAIFSNETAARASGTAAGNRYNEFENRLLRTIDETDSLALQQRVARFETNAGLSAGLLSTACASVGSCLERVKNKRVDLASAFRGEEKKLSDALADWSGN